jgi:O-antigen/teichoic acid export membrane protein
MLGKLLIKKVSWVLLSDVLIKIIGYMLLPYFLNKMAVSEFGEFGFIFSIISLLAPLFTLGLYVPQIREFTEAKVNTVKNEIYSSTLFTTLLFCFVLGIIVMIIPFVSNAVIFALQLSGSAYFKLGLVCVLTSLTSLNLINLSHSISLNNPRDLLYFNWSRFSLNSFFAIVLLNFDSLSNDNVLNRLFALITGEFLLLCLIILRNTSYLGFKYFNKNYLKGALISGLQIMPSTILLFIFSYFERFNLSTLVGKFALANYMLAIQLTAPIPMIMATIQSVWSPVFYQISTVNETLKKAKQMGLILAGVFLILSLGIGVLLKLSLLLDIIPSSYNEVSVLVIILALGVSISSLIQVVNNVLIKYDLERFVTYNYFLSLLVFLSVSPFLVRIYGVTGMAYSNVVYGIVLLILGIIFIYSKVRSDI